jgi:hypothetical protein
MRTTGIEAKGTITVVKGILGPMHPEVTVAARRDLPQIGEVGSYRRSHRLARLVWTTAVPRCPMDTLTRVMLAVAVVVEAPRAMILPLPELAVKSRCRPMLLEVSNAPGALTSH